MNTKPGRMISGELKRAILTGQITLYCTAFALLHFFIDASQGMYQSALFDAGIALAVFVCYLVNKLGYVQLAKALCLALLNIAFLLYASVVPKEVGVYLFFFPLIAVSSALFGNHEKLLRYTFIILPFVLLMVIFLTDFNLMLGLELEEPPGTKMFFVINIMSSSFVMILCIDFMLKLNEASENQLQKLNDEVKSKNLALERTNDELDRFLYSTSHDLQSPLSSIKGLINVARYDTSDSNMHSYFDKITNRVNSLEGFIRDIIDYSKNARTEVREESVDFTKLVSDVTENLKYLSGAEAIDFRKNIQVSHAMLMDKSRLNVVLTNLIANAIKYHDPRKAEKWIEVSVFNSNRSIKIRVNDNGTGIGQEHQSRIFDMFYRGTLQSTGSGLGLYIVKQAVEKLSGTISVQSNPGEGSSFLVSVPIA